MIPSDIVSSKKYKTYAFVDIPNAHSVSYFSNGQYELYQYVDTFDCGQGTMLCFKEQPKEEGFKHNFLVSNGSDSKIIQANNYESLHDIFTTPDVYPYSFYTFLNSIYIPGQSTQTDIGDVDHDVNGKKFERCDTSSYGPVPFYQVQSGYSIARIRHVLSLSGVGHILHFNTMNETIPNQTSQVVNMSGRTLASILKCVFEWAAVSGEPFNSEENPSIAASRFCNQLNISPQIIDDITAVQGNMRVFRYLSGHTQLFELFEETEQIPESVRNYFMERLSYRTLSALKKYHPSAEIAQIDESILAAEKTEIERAIFKFAIDNNVDVTLLNSENIKSSLTSIENPINLPQNIHQLIEDMIAYA